jgi:hypothetical protein
MAIAGAPSRYTAKRTVHEGHRCILLDLDHSTHAVKSNSAVAFLDDKAAAEIYGEGDVVLASSLMLPRRLRPSLPNAPKRGSRVLSRAHVRGHELS